MSLKKGLVAEVQRKNLTEQLFESLEDQIIGATLLPGTKLSEESIAEAFGVSRSPAREALTELERSGLATRVGPRDRFVVRPTKQLIQETFEVWWILDVGRTYLASLEATPEDHARLYELLDAIEAAEKNGERKKYAKRSEEWHDLLYRGCQNAALRGMLSSYDKYIKWFKTLYLDRLEVSEETRREHRQIIDCYAKKDLSGLTDVIQRHIFRQRDAVLANFSKAEAAEAAKGD